MRAICLIPARGGSKRLPRKNIVEFRGKPIIAYTIDAALQSGMFDRVVVSTEDREIAAVSAKFGAQIHARQPQLAGDTARLVEVCRSFIDESERGGERFDVLACLLATAPMRGAEDVRGVMNLIQPGACDFAMAVTTYGHPPLQALRKDIDGSLVPMWPEMVNLRSQETPPLLVDNGSTYAMTVEAFRAQGSFYGPGLRGYVMPRERSIDIDEPSDLLLARCLAEQMSA